MNEIYFSDGDSDRSLSSRIRYVLLRVSALAVAVDEWTLFFQRCLRLLLQSIQAIHSSDGYWCRSLGTRIISALQTVIVFANAVNE